MYEKQLIRHLLAQGTENEYVFFHSRPNDFFAGHEECILPHSYRYGMLSALTMVYRKFIRIPRELRARQIDLVHEMNMISPSTYDIWRPYAVVTTVYDITPLILRGVHTLLSVLGLSFFLRASLRASDRVLAISECTRRDIIEHLRIPSDRIRVTLLGTDIAERAESESLHYDTPYILSVGTLEPRKNLAFLVRAYVAMRERYPEVRERLVLVGKQGWRMGAFLDAIAGAERYRDDILITGFVSDESLVHLYRHARAFVYPSLYEGFGLPVLEAMTLGCPVITTDVSSLPEVVGAGGTCISPTDVDACVDAMYRLLTDETARTANIAYHTERAGEFSWERCARETLEVYREAYRVSPCHSVRSPRIPSEPT